MRTLLIAGTSGFLGGALTAYASENSWHVKHLVRREARSGDEVSWDPARGELDPAAIAAADAVVCVSGAGIADRPWTPARQREIISSRVGSVNLLARTIPELPSEQRPEVFVSGSAIGYYGSRGATELSEDSGPGEGWLPQVCLAWEAVAEAAEQAGVRTIQLRTGHLMDTGDGLLGVLEPLYRWHLGAQLGSGEQYFSSIWIGDAVAAIMFAIEDQEISGPINLVGPNPVTFNAWHEALQDALGRSSPLVAPTPLLAALGAMGEELLLTSQRVVPHALTQAGFTFAAPTVTEIIDRALAGPYAD